MAYGECGKSNRWIGEKRSRFHTTIERFLQKYDQNGTICSAKGSGGKRKSMELEDQKIIESVKRNRAISANHIKEDLYLTVCVQTIQNRVKKM